MLRSRTLFVHDLSAGFTHITQSQTNAALINVVNSSFLPLTPLQNLLKCCILGVYYQGWEVMHNLVMHYSNFVTFPSN